MRVETTSNRWTRLHCLSIYMKVLNCYKTLSECIKAIQGISLHLLFEIRERQAVELSSKAFRRHLNSLRNMLLIIQLSQRFQNCINAPWAISISRLMRGFIVSRGSGRVYEVKDGTNTLGRISCDIAVEVSSLSH